MDNDRTVYNERVTTPDQTSLSIWGDSHLNATYAFESPFSREPPSEKNDLHVFQKRILVSERPRIPTTLMQRLSFYRCYGTSFDTTTYFTIHHVGLNWVIWNYIITAIMKSLPMAYVYMFFACYAPEEHYYLSKIVPLTKGFIVASVMSSLCRLLTVARTCATLIMYIAGGMSERHPWNGCNSTTIANFESKCLTIKEIQDRWVKNNKTLEISIIGPNLIDGNETFIHSQMYYFLTTMSRIEHLVIFILVWLFAAITSNQIHRKWVWKTLNTCHWLLNVAMLMALVDFAMRTIEKPFYVPPPAKFTQKRSMLYDATLLVESFTAPPMLHILISRSKDEVNPSKESSLLVISNGLYFVFRSYVMFRMRDFCDSTVKFQLSALDTTHHGIYTIWTVYLSTLSSGEFACLMLHTIHCLLQCSLFMITLQCTIESLSWEWKQLNKKILHTLFFFTGATMYVLLKRREILLMLTYSVGMCTLVEMITIFYIYPIGRLVDDIMFLFGSPPTRLRVINMAITPIFFIIKYLLMLKSYCNVQATFRMPVFTYGYIPVFLPYIFGMLFVVCQAVCSRKMNWKMMFKPVDTWGPLDYVIRQLRKKYDSRDFIRSQSYRPLSRYITAKAESDAYEINIRYDFFPRRSTVTTYSYTMQNGSAHDNGYSFKRPSKESDRESTLEALYKRSDQGSLTNFCNIDQKSETEEKNNSSKQNRDSLELKHQIGVQKKSVKMKRSSSMLLLHRYNKSTTLSSEENFEIGNPDWNSEQGFQGNTENVNKGFSERSSKETVSMPKSDTKAKEHGLQIKDSSIEKNLEEKEITHTYLNTLNRKATGLELEDDIGCREYSSQFYPEITVDDNVKGDKKESNYPLTKKPDTKFIQKEMYTSSDQLIREESSVQLKYEDSEEGNSGQIIKHTKTRQDIVHTIGTDESDKEIYSSLTSERAAQIETQLTIKDNIKDQSDEDGDADLKNEVTTNKESRDKNTDDESKKQEKEKKD